jgi:hypothetical protein
MDISSAIHVFLSVRGAPAGFLSMRFGKLTRQAVGPALSLRPPWRGRCEHQPGRRPSPHKGPARYRRQPDIQAAPQCSPRRTHYLSGNGSGGLRQDDDRGSGRGRRLIHQQDTSTFTEIHRELCVPVADAMESAGDGQVIVTDSRLPELKGWRDHGSWGGRQRRVAGIDERPGGRGVNARQRRVGGLMTTRQIVLPVVLLRHRTLL